MQTELFSCQLNSLIGSIGYFSSRSGKILFAILSLTVGASLTLSLAPYGYWLISYMSLIGLVFLINIANIYKLSVTYLGFFWGIGFFGTSVSWVFVSIYKYGGTNLSVACLITGLFIAFLALFPTINLIILKKIKLINPKDWRFILAFPSSWVLMEIFRGWFLTGFPWGLLGYTQLNTGLKYYGSVFGVYGVSFLTAIIAALISYWLLNFKLSVGFIKNILKNCLPLVIITIILFGGLIIKNFNNNQLGRGKLNNDPNNIHSVAIIQGNIEPNDKFLFRDIDTLINYIKQIYWQSTAALNNIDLVIWPENSLPLELQHPGIKGFIDYINDIAKQKRFGLLLGVPILTNNWSNNYYNSVLGLGLADGVYHKINLVPFGDYVPLEQWFRGLIEFFNLPLSIFRPGELQQSAITLQANKLLATICYDIAFAEHLRSRVLQENPGIIVNVSEDGWFGDSLGPHQHLDIARMRAIESGKFIVRATTSGISAIVDPNGNIVKQAPMFTKSVLIGQYQDCYHRTIWSKVGNKIIVIFLIICMVFAKFSIIIRRKP